MERPFRFAPPVPAATSVVRPRLLGPLAHRFDLRLVTIEGGAGFGKTTLLAQAVAENRLARRGRDVWLTCEPADSTPTSLLGGLLLAIGGHVPSGPPTVADVCEAVWGAAPEPVCLVLDDAHHLDPGSSGEAVLQQLLDDLPANGHLVVAGRRLPALAASRLLVQHRAEAIGGGDLALADDEADELAERLGVDAALVRGAEGWPALAELRARLGTADARRFAWEEAVGPLPDGEREAFLVLVATGGTTIDALAQAVGHPVDGARLAQLPLVARDDHGGLRPHPLWEDLVADHLPADVVLAARRAVAGVLAARGEHPEAFELAAAAGDWPGALGLLFDACNDQRHPPWRDRMARWAALVPPALAAEPEVAYLRGMIERAGDHWSATMQASFAEALAGFRARHDELRELVGMVRASQAAWLLGDTGRLVEFLERGRELEAAGWPIASIRALNRAVLADIEGRTDDVLRAVDGLHDLEPRLRHFPPLLRVFVGLATGDAEGVRRDADDAAEAGRAVATAAGGGWAALAPAVVAWAAGDLIEPPVEPGPAQSIAERIPTLALAVVVAAHRGDVARARASLSAMDELVPFVGGRDLVAGFRAVAGAAVAVADGDEAGAAAVLAELLDGRELAPSAAGRAICWFPSLPHLLHPASRDALASLGSGPARARTLDACDALLAARAGRSWSVPALLDDPEALVTALPIPLGCELAVRAAVAGHDAVPTVTALAALAPDPTRAALRRLADGGAPMAAAAKALLGSVPIPPAHAVRIEVLGPPRLLVDGEPTADANWRRTRVRQLLGVLVAHRSIRRDRLGVLLWPDFDEAGVSANLRMTLSYVQALLEPGRGRGHAPWFLQQDAGLLRLVGGDRLSVDLWDLEAHLDGAAAAASDGMPSVELAHLVEVLALWRGDPLDDAAGEEWADPLRERLCSRFVSGAVRAGELLVAAGRPTEAIRAADAALAVDRWSTSAHELLARAQAAAGDDDAARRAEESAERRRAELDLPPG